MSYVEELNQLSGDIEKWRSKRTSLSQQVPLEFIKRAYTLRKHFKHSDIQKATKIGQYQFKRLGTTNSIKSVDSVLNQKTVHLVDVLAPRSFSIEVGSGIRLDCQVDDKDLVDVISSLVRSLGSARRIDA